MRYLLILLILCCLLVIQCAEVEERSALDSSEVTSDPEVEFVDSIVSRNLNNLKKDSIWTQPPGWSELSNSDSVVIDLRYATEDNFVQTQLYDCPRCFVKKEVYDKLMLIRGELKLKGFRFKFFDCNRPLSVHKRLWEIKPDATYVTDPKKGSMHNRGLAVDVTLVRENGEVLDMGTAYDYFGWAAHQDYFEHPRHILENRKILKGVMEKHGFKSIRTEWWHYSYYIAQQPIEDWSWWCHQSQ